jgi:hypothetical protein
VPYILEDLNENGREIGRLDDNFDATDDAAAEVMGRVPPEVTLKWGSHRGSEYAEHDAKIERGDSRYRAALIDHLFQQEDVRLVPER